MFEPLYRRAVLGVAEAPPVAHFIKRQGWKLGVGRFVAGETLEDALSALEALEAKGMSGILDLLGEFVDSEAGALAMTERILQTLARLAETELTRYMSVKPTQLGLGRSPDLARANARRILARAGEVGARICFDMENHPYAEGTLELFTTLYQEGFHHASTVLQSYLRRSPADLERLLALEPKPALRLVKGAYRERPEVAFQDKRAVDERYRALMRRALEGGLYLGVATHDERLIQEAKRLAQALGLERQRYEFQLLYGVKPALQRRLVEEGHRVRVYVPYGDDWYGYFSRRLAERPANLMVVLRGLFG